MRTTSGGLINLLIVWGIASATGFVAMAGLLVLGEWSLMQALFAAAVVFLGLGIVLSVLFLNPLPGPQVPGTAGQSASISSAASTPTDHAKPVPAPAPAPARVAASPAPTKPAPAPAQGSGKRPAALSAARDNQADDLKQIKGIGPKLEKLCNNLGFYHFDQIAAWTDDEILWVDQNLEGFKGRVVRDDWVAQAKELAKHG